ncbi:MAG: NnrS family protein, partial [Alphaproteobacteria bacterium]
ALVGGRVTPSFTRNWLVKRNATALPAPFGRFDIASLVVTAVAMVLWAAQPIAATTAAVLWIAAVLHFIRLARWQGWQTTSEPLLAVLHVAYAWLPISLALLALNTGAFGFYSPASGIHALTTGLVGMMTVAVMTRAILGHTGRNLTAGTGTTAIFVLLFLGAALRVAAPLLPFDYTHTLHVAGTIWAAGFLLFAVIYGRLVIRA